MDDLTPAELDPRWQQVRDRDPDADGRFFYAVTTTGVYCRPTCPARRPRPANLRFFDSADQAEAAGFRPCLRCNPRGQGVAQANADRVAAACRMIDQAVAQGERPPGLGALAHAAGQSPWHFHRQFRAVTGLTPRAYAQARRAQRMRAGLAQGQGVTQAVYEAGYGSGSRFYENADKVLGMTATSYRDKGHGATIRFAIGRGALGEVLVAQSDRGICAITMGDDPQALLDDLQDRFPKARLIGGDADFERVVARVLAFVEAPGAGLDLPLDIRGTAFQQMVWQALQQIPPGQTASYAQIAERIGQPRAVRAVAGACAANPLAVVIPCHRVLRSDGGLSGYRWGIERKRDLLARER
ncbi:bifunctional DNA-binding transcriptional regulator/O6-methylguanine-DNA methyltransferase Ada [uncultured Paracoccus sp.]|uniref:bifunctional DNA-binding transcriptional regulator/O6-methylguanine-DNA methyltransferase Ada n=1 Tax=uncultured Paracoccus sp. TaxID=189685 RepID=UPI0025D20E35|nr:bifunctional DNA-binding transcriptional regulator/O6-methylguanine-DNA methyltransferase Ada [uncultured Paracoccus sp.]